MTEDKSTGISRRALLERALGSLAAAPLLAHCVQDSLPGSAPTTPTTNPGSPQLQMAMLLYPGFTMLDLVGPQCSLGRIAQTHLVWSAREPVMSDSGIALMATTTYADCPLAVDVLFVPGGACADAMQDPAALQFLRERAPRARYVTSVCTGSLVLAAAGLLDGYRAATHWAARDILALFDVEVVDERVVIDRNRFTGGGVTAGIDFGLTLVAELQGEPVAKLQQLLMEYDPAPPYAAGSPESAGPEILALAQPVITMLNTSVVAAAEAVIGSS